MSDSNNKTNTDDIVSLEDSARTFWWGMAEKLVQEAIPAIEEAAKQAATIAGILIGFYTNILAFSELPQKNPELWQVVLYLVPLVFWVIGLSCALSVFWTKTYEVTLFNAEQAKETFDNIIKRKHSRTRFSFVLLSVGIIFTIISIFIYFSY